VFHIGPASVAVPGMVAGLGEAMRRFGRLAMADVVAPAVRIAREGVVLTREAAYLHRILGDMLTASHESAAVYAPRGRLLGAGDRLRNDDLADALETIGREGPEAMRGGSLGRAVLDHLRAHGGLVTAEDVAAYRVIDRAPLRVRYRGLELLTNPPPSSGGALIAVALRAMEHGDAPGADDVARYRAVARAGAAANAVRGEGFGDLLGEEDVVERLWARRPTGTTHASAVDGDGGMASLSSSNGSGSGAMAPGTGILLNNMLGEEDLNPGGFGQTDPGERMTSMMAPSLLLRDGEPVMALGSAGSNRLRSAILQTVVNLVDGGMDVRAAVRHPRVHPEGDGVDVEGGVPDAAVAALVADGHLVRRWGEMNLFFGGVSAAGIGRDGVEAAGDPRRGGGAAALTAAGEVIDL
jgi:gamma-glutamyltranspeptidase/glutathione hydrolase